MLVEKEWNEKMKKESQLEISHNQIEILMEDQEEEFKLEKH